MSKRKNKVVRYDGDTALEYQQDDAGMSLVGVRPLPAGAADISGLKDFDVIAFNREAEKLFVSMLSEMIRRGGRVPVRVVRSSLAFRLGVSVETIKRYLEKWAAPVDGAPFAVVDGCVILNQGRIEGNDDGSSRSSSGKVGRIEGNDDGSSRSSSRKKGKNGKRARNIYIPRRKRRNES